MPYLRGHWQLALIALAVLVLWSTPVLYPVRILIVFLHELSHGLAALITGGSIESLTLTPDEGGLTLTRGGNRFLILSAGYLGSLLFGVALFLAALRTRLDRAVVAALGLCSLVIAALYIRDGFPLIFCLLTGVALLLIARFTSHGGNDLALRVVGLSSMFYVPEDIVSDTISRSHLPSDARMLAEEFGAATVIWGGAWFLISLAVIALTLRLGLGASSNLALRSAGPGESPIPPRS
ncbi:MAG: M50 family metallopeptidase [Tabrizicola sp.]|nr:M50 family metallopeptidase [Tabrizicola sp.]